MTLTAAKGNATAAPHASVRAMRELERRELEFCGPGRCELERCERFRIVLNAKTVRRMTVRSRRRYPPSMRPLSVLRSCGAAVGRFEPPIAARAIPPVI